MADEKNYLDITVTADQAKKGIEEIANIFDSNILENNGKFLKVSVDTADLPENPTEKELLEKTSLSFEMPLTEVDDLTIVKDANGVISGAGAKVGNKVFTIDGQQYTAGEGAEIFNDYETNICLGYDSAVMGANNKSFANNSFIAGLNNTIGIPGKNEAASSVVLGASNGIPRGYQSCVIGIGNTNYGNDNFVTGNSNNVYGYGWLVSGMDNTVGSANEEMTSFYGGYAGVIGARNNITSSGYDCFAIGSDNTIDGTNYRCQIYGFYNSMTDGSNTLDTVYDSYIIGRRNSIIGGYDNVVLGYNHTVENSSHHILIAGRENKSSRCTDGTFICGYKNIIEEGYSSLIFGANNNLLSGPDCSLIGGMQNEMAEDSAITLQSSCIVANSTHINSSYDASALFGTRNTINGSCASGTIASGFRNTVGSLYSSIVVGQYNTVSNATGSLTVGSNLITSGRHQSTTLGKYNKEDTNGDYCFIIGNGDSSNRSNAIEITWDGDINSASGVISSSNGITFKDSSTLESVTFSVAELAALKELL